MTGQTGPKRTKIQRKADLKIITESYLKGMTQIEIARVLAEIRPYAISQQMVSNDLRHVQKQWRTDTSMALDEYKARELARLDLLEREYWQAWEKSQKPRKRHRVNYGDDQPDMSVDRKPRAVLLDTEERIGDPRFLQGVERCIQQRCKLLGIEAPARYDLGLTNFDKLLLALRDEGQDGDSGK